LIDWDWIFVNCCNIFNFTQELLPKRFTIKAPYKEGYLVKQGGVVRTWKKRWFVLKASPSPILYYYEKSGVGFFLFC
jgi:hypothetical protein